MVSFSSAWAAAAAPSAAGGPAGAGVLLRLVHDNPFEYDFQRRVPDAEEAKNVLGFDHHAQ